MARRDEVVAHFPGRAIGRGRAAHMAARALLGADEGIGKIDHAERVASRPPAGHRVGHQPIAGRAVTRLAANALARRRAAAGRMAADAGGVFVGGHHGPRRVAGGEERDDLRGERLVEHPFGPRVRIMGGPDRVAALPGRVALDRGRMAARRRAAAGPEQCPRWLHGPGWIAGCRIRARGSSAVSRASQAHRQQGEPREGGRSQHGSDERRCAPGGAWTSACVRSLETISRGGHATRLLAATGQHWRGEPWS